MKHIKLNRISLKNHSTITERWLQEIISDDPSLLCLGELVVRDKERRQIGAGRLDLLLQDPESKARYEVEIQLGATDESHIIRTLEYWDIERKRYPQYDHTAVIIAEDITSRFLNVITLFNGHIPLIALQVSAYDHPDGISLSFTKVLDAVRLGAVGEDEEVAEPTNRNFWETERSSKSTMEVVDQIFQLTHTFDSNLQLSYNKHYIGFWLNGSAYNFATIRPRRSVLILEFKVPQEEMQTTVNEVLGEDSELDIMDYDSRWGRSRIRLTPSSFNKNQEVIKRLLHDAYEYRK
ncbi:hypothetical protein KOE80_12565 [Alcaligenes sp. 13f]|uniref:hypothetical protein n=1 Tax=Alcaligenes sp. 13f TaxID=2841924 RepID=UPI001CF70078|nr:hypothetical protein [Alcaligenes sp. 13f]MCB4323033.1 hypothetical protein [Alcaligenes sp. 13f]